MLEGNLYAISVDEAALSKPIVEAEKLPFAILSDPGGKVAASFGLLQKGSGPEGQDIAVPAHVLIRQDGRIAWRYVSRKIHERVDPLEIAEQIKRLRAP